MVGARGSYVNYVKFSCDTTGLVVSLLMLQVREWIHQAGGKRLLLITAEAGMGKSVAAALLKAEIPAIKVHHVAPVAQPRVHT